MTAIVKSEFYDYFKVIIISISTLWQENKARCRCTPNNTKCLDYRRRLMAESGEQYVLTLDSVELCFQTFNIPFFTWILVIRIQHRSYRHYIYIVYICCVIMYTRGTNYVNFFALDTRQKASFIGLKQYSYIMSWKLGRNCKSILAVASLCLNSILIHNMSDLSEKLKTNILNTRFFSYTKNYPSNRDARTQACDVNTTVVLLILTQKKEAFNIFISSLW